MDMFITINGLILFIGLFVLMTGSDKSQGFIKGGTIFITGFINYFVIILLLELIPYSTLLSIMHYDVYTLPFKIVFWKWFLILGFCAIFLLLLTYLYITLGKLLMPIYLNYWKIFWSNFLLIILFGLITYNNEDPEWDSYSYQNKRIITLNSDEMFGNLSSLYFINEAEISFMQLRINEGGTGLYFDGAELFINRNVWTKYFSSFTHLDTHLFSRKYDDQNERGMYESHCMFWETAFCKGYRPNDKAKISQNFWESGLTVLKYLYEVFLKSFSSAIIVSIILMALFFFKEERFLSDEINY